MKTILHKTVIAVLFTLSTFYVSGQCNYTAGGNGASRFAITPIIINGVMDDWTPFLSDADNNVYDNTSGSDLNAPISDNGRDLTRVVFTSDLTNIYVYFERAGSTNNKVDFLLYLDINNNNLMEQGEPVITFDWSGSNGAVGSSIYNYVPSATSSQNVLSNHLDGSHLGGNLSNRSYIGHTGKGSLDGKSMEAKIPFALLTTVNGLGAITHQLNPGQSYKFHLSSINGNIGSVPNDNSINDDFGGCVIAPMPVGLLPVQVLGFDALVKDQSVLLNWNTTNHSNFSRFVIERSSDAVNFKQAAIVFGENKGTAEYNFAYKDQLKNLGAGVYYYRIKMIDVDGSYNYTDIKSVRITAQSEKVKIAVFPNPMTNEVHVTIPDTWKNKEVVYEIYNNSGILVQRTSVKNAVQTQSLNVQQLTAGMYLIKTSNGFNSNSSVVIK